MTTITETPKLAVVFGASGFLGRHVVRALAKRGWRIRAVTRSPGMPMHLQPIGNMSQIAPFQASVTLPASVERAVEGADLVVNLVGILYESGRATFDGIQHKGARNVAEAAARVGSKLVHLSAIGADLASKSDYARTKAEGERAVLGSHPDAVILRPSIVFGPEDDFFNRFADMARYSPALPLIGGGHTRYQPVYVGDVAEAVALAGDSKLSRGATYELGGPEVLTFRELMERMLKVIGRRRMLVPVPWPVAEIQGKVLGMLPKPLLTSDQVELLRSDNVVSSAAEGEGRTLAGMGIQPDSLEAILPSYLWRFRETGQFATKRAFARN
ncbi:MAG: complex I NDUFA9 subunit family protein [Methylobacterium mesophilicum]|nr:complex I NDUFA9 subunit family protein [Methylobacterium mesophilicum]